MDKKGNLKKGDLVIYKYTPRGGYGYKIEVKANVVSIKGSQVTIQYQSVFSTKEKITVHIDSLKSI